MLLAQRLLAQRQLQRCRNRSAARQLPRAARPAGRACRPCRERQRAGGRGIPTPSCQPDRDAETPWVFGFQCNERYLQWDNSAQRELIRIYLCKKLDLTEEQLAEQLAELATLLPDMVGKLESCKASILEALLADMPGLASRLLQLKALMPATNISGLVAKHPALVLEMAPQQVQAQLQHLEQHLPNADVELLVYDEPAFLRVDVGKVLSELRRLLPRQDPVQALLANPGLVLDMDSAGQASSIEKEGELIDEAMLRGS